jgi:hypothetical protein
MRKRTRRAAITALLAAGLAAALYAPSGLVMTWAW